MTIQFEQIQEECEDIVNELTILRGVLEATITNNARYMPMVTIFDSDHKRILALVPPPQDTFTNTLSRIAECLYLYPALSPSCAVISMNSQINDSNSQVIECLQVFVISVHTGYGILMPYERNNDNTITWKFDDFTSENLTESSFEDDSKDMVNLFFMFTHIDNAPYTVSEILSYLSSNGTEIKMLGDMEISYFSSQQ